MGQSRRGPRYTAHALAPDCRNEPRAREVRVVRSPQSTWNGGSAEPKVKVAEDLACRPCSLCGGTGTRAYPHSLEVPKPLMTVGDAPVLLHLMQIYARQGFTDFVLSAGYRADLVATFPMTLPPVAGPGRSTPAKTPGRRAASSDVALGTRAPFMATYGDGLGAVDLTSLLEFHNSHPGAVTVTAVPLPSPYGTIEWDETRTGRALRREADADRPLDQRRLLRHRRPGFRALGGRRPRTRGAARPGRRRGAVRVSARRFLAVDGHLQRRIGAECSLPGRRWPVDDLAGSRVLVTGATGFIGSHLSRRLVERRGRGPRAHEYRLLGLPGPARRHQGPDHPARRQPQRQRGHGLGGRASPTRDRVPSRCVHARREVLGPGRRVHPDQHPRNREPSAGPGPDNYDASSTRAPARSTETCAVPFREDAVVEPSLAVLGEQVRRRALLSHAPPGDGHGRSWSSGPSTPTDPPRARTGSFPRSS